MESNFCFLFAAGPHVSRTLELTTAKSSRKLVLQLDGRMKYDVYHQPVLNSFLLSPISMCHPIDWLHCVIIFQH